MKIAGPLTIGVADSSAGTRRALLAVFDTPGPVHGFIRPYRGELFQLMR